MCLAEEFQLSNSAVCGSCAACIVSILLPASFESKHIWELNNNNNKIMNGICRLEPWIYMAKACIFKEKTIMNKICRLEACVWC